MAKAETAQVAPEPRSIYVELYDGDRIRSGEALIFHAAEVPQDVINREVEYAFSAGWDRVLTEVQHLTFSPRVKWCSRYDGFGCDNEGEWHAHWFGVKHNPVSDCCHTVAMPVFSPGTQP